MTDLRFESIVKSPDPLAEDTNVTVTFVIKNYEGSGSSNNFSTFILKNTKSTTDLPTDHFSYVNYLARHADAHLIHSPLAALGTTQCSITLTGSKSVRYVTCIFDEYLTSTTVSTSYTVTIDTFSEGYKRGLMFIGTGSALGAKNDVTYIMGDENFNNNVGKTFNIPFILNQTNYKKIDEDYWTMHYDSSTYTYGATLTPAPESPSLQIHDPAKIAAKNGYVPFIGGSNIALSYYRNPSNARTVTSTVNELIGKIPQLSTTSGGIYSFTLPLGLTRGRNQYYSNILTDLAGLVNAEYWQSTTRAARTGASSLTPRFYFQPIYYDTDVASVQTFDCDNTTTPDNTYYVINSNLHLSTEKSDDFYNVVEIFGGTDDKGMPVYTKIRDEYSVTTYGTTFLSITDSSIDSYEEAVDYAEDLLAIGSRGRVKGTITVSGDWQQLHSQHIVFNDTRNGWVNEDLMVRSTRYILSDHKTELSINNEYIDNRKVIDSFLYLLKKNETFVVPSTNEEVKYVSVVNTYNGAISDGQTYYMGLCTSGTTSAELSGEGYERKAVVMSGTNATNYTYVHTRAVWQPWDGRTTDSSPITHIYLFSAATGSTYAFGPYAVDSGKAYKWRSTQLYISLCINTT